MAQTRRIMQQTAALSRTPTLGTTPGGVRFTDAPRHQRHLVTGYAPTGWENAPVEGMDDDPSGLNAMRGLWNGLILGLPLFAMLAASVMFAVVPVVRWVVS